MIFKTMMTSKQSLKVGVDARSLLCREPRGEGKALLRLYREICLLRPDIDIVFFGDRTSRSYHGELPQGVSVVSLNLPGERFSAWENIYLPVAAMFTGCQVLHCTSSGGPFWSAQPQLLTIHDLIPLRFDDGHSEKEKRHFLKRLNNGIRNAKRIITVSAHTRNDLLAIFPDLQSPIDVIHWGSDRISEPTGKSAVDSPYLIAFGGEAKRKNTQYTLDRYFAAATSLPDLKLIMVGISSKKLRENVIQFAEQRGLRERVILPGFVSESELDSLIRNATALLYLSLYEGFGLPVLEAIERGVPVIASDRTSMPEVLGGTIGCFPLENPNTIERAIIDLVTYPDECKRWQVEQAKNLPRFDWKNTAMRTIRVLESCV